MVTEKEHEKRWFEELRGESSDRPFRAGLESKARRLIWPLDNTDFEQITELCAPNVRLLAELKSPGQIYEGLDEIREYCKMNSGDSYELITIVDRLRVICPVDFMSDPVEGRTSIKQRKVIILDMNNDHKFVRIEMRPLGPKELVDWEGLEVKELEADNSL
ncbi:hypothetical protein CORC01_09887 [Colletotrichum orchidophilum]|uniref:SnoaL-like domain-containing protein n=1 Tax=Colletotrichum orchidophilum TaxID=1209926 RepID=A0A1G4B032_9PEZI|nr:uncharacterized protein CORC01_09887 [Colletotrichum orchidophilum]OHE94780.1 hypothetical protein CORC01_09887 [Colletotrichum orchidophilum]